jgi:hypothetical protein
MTATLMVAAANNFLKNPRAYSLQISTQITLPVE